MVLKTDEFFTRSKSWANALQDENLALGYTHITVNHRRNFVVHQGIHTNTIDNMWGQFKRKLRRMQGCRRTFLSSYKDEFLWRRNGSKEKVFLDTLHAITRQYSL